MMPFEIDISNRQKSVVVDCSAIRTAILQALQIEQVASAVLSISIVDNSEIQTINREHLQHDYPTDVISFQLEFVRNDDTDDADPDSADEPEPKASVLRPDAAVSTDTDAPSLRAVHACIEGEVVVSAEMALEMASVGRWSAQDELTLYVIHGLLHICGYDDQTPEERAIMRNRERAILSATGRQVIYPKDPKNSLPERIGGPGTQGRPLN